MSENRKPMSAAELMAQLEIDPEYRQRRADRDRRLRQQQEASAAMERPILDELRAQGFKSDSISDVVKTHAPLSARLVDILRRRLESLSNDPLEDGSDSARLAESLVRALGATRVRFNGQPLVACFERTSDESLRFAIANTIALTRPHSIDGWLSEKLKDPYWGNKLRALGLKA